jgi:predicted  nucleic acid-binding Zn-ribbon protein
MILEVLRLEEKVKKFEGEPKASGKQSEKLANAGDMGEIGRLKKELAARDRDIEILKKQSEGLSREYGDLSDKYSATQADGTPKKDR